MRLNHLLIGLVILGLSACGKRITPTSGVAPQGWVQHADMLTARSEMPAVELEGLIYVPGGFGGESQFEVYDPEKDAWEGLDFLPEPRHHLMAAAHSGRVYIFGGGISLLNWTPTSRVWAFDPLIGSWAEMAPMPEARLGGAAVSLGEFIFIVGGVGGSNALMRYDPVQDRWESLSALSQPREHTAAVAFEGKIYAIGGRWEGVGELSSVEIYDPVSGTWSAGAELSVARAGHAAAVLGERILALGGEVLRGGRQALDSVEVLDSGGEWTPGPPLPVGLHGVSAIGLGERLFVLGGSDRAGGIDNAGRVLSLSLLELR